MKELIEKIQEIKGIIIKKQMYEIASMVRDLEKKVESYNTQPDPIQYKLSYENSTKFEHFLKALYVNYPEVFQDFIKTLDKK